MKTYGKTRRFTLTSLLCAILFGLTVTREATAQFASPPVVCYGQPIQLFCGGLPGCGVGTSTFTWCDESGTWSSNDKNPVISPGSPGYHSGPFYLSIIYLPEGLSSGVASVLLLTPISISGTTTNITCNGSSTGAITITPSGGQPGYGPFKWSSGQTTQNISGISAGTYTVTVSDAYLCTAIKSFTITQPAGMTVTGTTVNVLCYGLSTGAISTTTTGGTPLYNYLWNTGATTPGISNLAAGTYTITVTDANTCKSVKSSVITSPTALGANGTVANVTCYGGNNGIASFTAYGGTPPYLYHWGIGGYSQMINGLTAGRYYLTITDANMCQLFTWMDITQPTDIQITGTATGNTCTGISDGQITTTISGGSGGPAAYLWSNGQTGATAVNLPVGNYTVTVTNAAGCTKVSQLFTIQTRFLSPGAAGAVTGPSVVGKGASGVVFSTTAIANATRYGWSLPFGATISDSSNPTAIVVNFSENAISGVVTVRGINQCGNGASSPDFNLTVLPVNLALENITHSFSVYCYDALQTITVAGGGSSFVVQGSASVTLVAGTNILYYPGTKVASGGYLHGYIATNGTFCTYVVPPLVGNQSSTGIEKTAEIEIMKSPRTLVYPNPTAGTCTIEVIENRSDQVKVEVYSMDGVAVLTKVIKGASKCTINLENFHPGMYLVHVTTDTEHAIVKLIKL